jgi:dimethylglycine catabolism B
VSYLSDLLLFGIAYYIIYAAAVASVIAIVTSVVVPSRKAVPTGLRLRLLGKFETRRALTLDPLQLMHLSIVLGVGLSILIFVLDPIIALIPPIGIILLILSLPLDVGLIAAFAWRVERFVRSKQVEINLNTGSTFTQASTLLQLILIITIALTTAELILSWFVNFAIFGFALNIVRNTLVVIYYSKPSVNIIKQFDKPLPSLPLPFKLNDILKGKTDASQIEVGVNVVSEFSAKEKMSYHSCIEIGACEAACPATAAGRPLSPRVLMREIALLATKKGETARAFETVKEDELWSCTTCGACVHSCPVAVKHLDIVYDLRRTLVSQGKLANDKATLLQNLSQHQNPYGLSSSSRADWAKGQGIETIDMNPKAEYLYWVGCVSSFDQRAQNIAKSLSKILKAAGISSAIMGNDEACNGDPARRLGEEGRYQELVYQNIEKLNSYGVKKIITSCPHCYNALKNEYPIFGGLYEVIHHTQLISNLIEERKITVSKAKLQEISVTLHDACYMTRYNSIYEEPRKVLQATYNDIREMHRTKDRTFCCGAGGSNYWYKVPQQRTISGIRTKEASDTGAATIATECPFCLSMFEDSTKVSDTKMAVRDIAEIVVEVLQF